MQDNDLPIHHFTGLRAVGIVNGRPVWPIKGGDGTGDGAGDGGQGGDGDGAGDGGDGGQGRSFRAPQSQEELDRIINQAVARAHKQYGMTPDDVAKLKERAEKLDYDLGTDAARAAADARAEERSKADSEYAPRLVRQAFRAEAKGVLSGDQLDALLEDYNPQNYIDADGDVDEKKIAARVAKFAGGGSGSGHGKTPPPQLGQGRQQPTREQPGDRGRAEAQRRFGQRQPA